ncbi:hypothetical protein EJB05_28103, partial [Eragrostis curvula]
MASRNGPGGRVVFFPFPYQVHFNPVLRLAGALHARRLAVIVFHTELRAPDPADFAGDYHFVPVPVEIPPEVVASEDIARQVIELNASCKAPFKDRLAALLADGEEGGRVLHVITDVIWHSAQAAARELGVPAMGMMTSCASSFRTFMAYPILIEKGYLPVQASPTCHPSVGQSRCSTAVLRSYNQHLRSLEAADLHKIREEMAIQVFAVGLLNKLSPAAKTSLYQLQPDRRCLDWLDTQVPCSVIYVSFGSLAAMDPH